MTRPSRSRMFPYSRWRAAPTSATRTIATSDVAMASSWDRWANTTSAGTKTTPPPTPSRPPATPAAKPSAQRPATSTTLIRSPGSRRRPTAPPRTRPRRHARRCAAGARCRRARRRWPAQRRAGPSRGPRCRRRHGPPPRAHRSPRSRPARCRWPRGARSHPEHEQGNDDRPAANAEEARERAGGGGDGGQAHRGILRRVVEALSPVTADPSRSALFFDVDGTLAPIVQRAEDAHVPQDSSLLLARLSRRYVRVACISGRSAADVRRLVGVGGIAYAGSHGAELLEPNAAAPRIAPEFQRWEPEV